MTTLEDEEVPNVARIYDYLLGGAHNFATDREHTEQILAVYPDAALFAWANRNFLRHAVEYALARGIDQFLDLGSGIPTVGNVHEIAQRARPEARVVYVEYDPVAVAHSRELLAGNDHAVIIEADITDAEAVLAAPGIEVLDFSRPVAVLAFAVLHFVPDSADLPSVLTRYRGPLTAGSLLAMTHSSADYPDHPEIVEARRRVLEAYAGTSNPGYDRSRAEIRAIVEAAGFAVNGDGLVDISRWAPPQHDGRPLGAYALITEPLDP